MLRAKAQPAVAPGEKLGARARHAAAGPKGGPAQSAVSRLPAVIRTPGSERQGGLRL